jgi:membrane fusion protein (multidrug efflux system)
MNPSSRRKRAFVFSIVLLALLVAASLARLYIHRKSSAGAASQGGPATARSQPQSKGQGTQGVALASTKTPGASVEKSKNGEEKEKTPVPVSVAAIAMGPVSSYISSTANLVAENEVKVLAEAEGRVAELHVEEGNRIGKAHVLAQLVKDDTEIALKKAQVRLENARVNFERAEQEVADHLISQEQFDKDRLDLQIAQQELAEAQWRLDKTTIRAPFGGRITERFVKLGQHVHPGDQLFTVSDFDPLIAKIFLPEKDVYGLKEGREVRITLKANEQTHFQGRIRQISPVVDTATGTVKLTIEAKEPPAEVRPGAFVTIDIVRTTHPQAVLVPREAVIRELQDAYVFVAQGGVAEKRTVALGLEEGGRVEALSGVKAGEQVIVAGQGGLKHGSPIKVIPSPEASELGAVADRPSRG